MPADEDGKSRNAAALTAQSAQALLLDLANTFASAAAFRDLDDRSEGESAKRISELPDATARYRTLVEQIPAVIFMAFLDQNLSEAYVSPHVETVLGFTQEQWLNDPIRWYNQIHPDDRDRWSVEAAQLILSGQPLRSVYRVMARDGHVVWFHCEVKIVLSQSGRPWFLHGTAFDITNVKETETALQRARDELETRVLERTAELSEANRKLQLEIAERKRAEAELARTVEELKRSNADLEQFAHSASHDLQEPLRMVSIYSQMLQRRCAGRLGEGEEDIRQIRTGTERMQQLLADLRSYIQASRSGDETVQDADASEALERALINLTHAIQLSGAAVTYGRLPWVRLHEFQLQQLFQNLVANAICYRSKAPPRIEISAEACGHQWKFAVRDNGIGIDPLYHEQIFGMFKRLHNWANCPGSGMGLAICKRIVERAGGRIWVESKVGEGSTFLFTLPEGANRS